MPAAGEGRSTVLGLVLLQARLQLGSEVADETLDRPGESFAQSCGEIYVSSYIAFYST